MKIFKILIVFILAFAVIIAQTGAVFAAPAYKTTLLTGNVLSITLETDINTAVITILVTIEDANKIPQTVRLGQKTGLELGLLIPDINGGIPVINLNALGKPIQINPKTVIADDEANQHPVGAALATFFTETTDYETIMKAHEAGSGFGIIAQALWLTQKLEGDSATFLEILKAKETGDFSYFAIVDENGTTTIPKNWGQFRKAILEGDKKGKLGVIMSNKDKDKDNIVKNDENKDKDKDNNGKNDENKDKDKGNGKTK